jgi:hypothetical protein
LRASIFNSLGTEGHNDKVELRGKVEELGEVHSDDDVLTCLSHSRCAEKDKSGCLGRERWGKSMRFQHSKLEKIWNTDMATMPMGQTARILTWMILWLLEHESLPT